MLGIEEVIGAVTSPDISLQTTPMMNKRPIVLDEEAQYIKSTCTAIKGIDEGYGVVSSVVG
jgi:hypothetical protein